MKILDKKFKKSKSEEGKKRPKDLEKNTIAYEYKPVQRKKLTVLLIENSIRLANKDIIFKKIIDSCCNAKNLMCIINYGSIIKKSDIFEISQNRSPNFSNNEDFGKNKCLYDVLIEVEQLIVLNYNKIQENRTLISEVEIIGIGTCSDNASKNSKQDAIDSFYRSINLSNAITKYYCIDEESAISAAEIGFHSIGTILKK